MVSDFKSIHDLIKAFPAEQDCINHLETLRWNGVPVSPFDETSKVYKCAGNKYKCKNTGKYFNVKVGTIFEDTKIPLIKWFMALYIFSSHKKGISSHQLAKDIDVTQKSAWFMLHRLRYAFEHPNFKEIVDSTVEIDETYVGGDKKNKHKSKRNKGEGTGYVDKTPVLGILERNGNVNCTVLEKADGLSIKPVIFDQIKLGSTLITDGFGAYTGLNRYYNHHVINHAQGEYVRGRVHTNTIEGFWSHLKRGIKGIYHWVSVDHLQSYVDEFSYRYNTRKLNTNERFNLVLTNVAGRLTYKELTK